MALAISEGAGRPATELARWARRLAAVGVDTVQVREKTLSDVQRLERGRAVAAALSGTATRLLINGRFDIAMAVEAGGVHLPERGLPLAAVREALGPEALIGRSTHSVEAVHRAQEEGADYVTLGPIYETPSKGQFGPPLGLETLARAAAIGVPVLAIGGISVERLAELADAGARGVAAIRLFQTGGAELEAGVRRIVEAFEGA